jgi:hypothetical protein
MDDALAKRFPAMGPLLTVIQSLGLLALFALTLTASPANAKDPQPADTQVESLTKGVIDPLTQELAQSNREGQEHASKVDSGAIEIVRTAREAQDKRTDGWVLMVIHPLERPIYTSTYTVDGIPNWSWADNDHKHANITYEETLFTKTADSTKQLTQDSWVKTMSHTHKFKADFVDGGWKVEELDAFNTQVVPHEP